MSDLTIQRGDDYAIADGLQLIWTDTTDAWPTLTGATITLEIEDLVATGNVVTATGTPKKVNVPLTAAQTATLTIGTLDYAVRATIGGRRITLATGEIEVE